MLWTMKKVFKRVKIFFYKTKSKCWKKDWVVNFNFKDPFVIFLWRFSCNRSDKFFVEWVASPFHGKSLRYKEELSSIRADEARGLNVKHLFFFLYQELV
jgi:hypothetical protein